MRWKDGNWYRGRFLRYDITEKWRANFGLLKMEKMPRSRYLVLKFCSKPGGITKAGESGSHGDPAMGAECPVPTGTVGLTDASINAVTTYRPDQGLFYVVD